MSDYIFNKPDLDQKKLCQEGRKRKTQKLRDRAARRKEQENLKKRCNNIIKLRESDRAELEKNDPFATDFSYTMSNLVVDLERDLEISRFLENRCNPN
jgi:hypothetical protein